MWSLTDSKSKRFYFFLAVFIVGIASGSAFFVVPWSAYLLGGGAVLLVGALWLARKTPVKRLVLLAGLFFIFGAWRVSVDHAYLTREASIFSFAGETVSLRGQVISLPKQRGERTEYRLRVAQRFAGGLWQPVYGTILLKTRSYPIFEYGDLLSFTCEPEAPVGRRWGRLASERVGVECTVRAGVERIANKKGDLLLAALFRLRARALDRLKHLLPEPHAGLAGGLLVGERANLPSDLVTALRRTGTTHIIAISGFNVAMITRTLFSFLAMIIGRRRAYYTTIAFLFGFVFLVGGSASVVRAAIMGGTVLVAGFVGRETAGFRLLVLAAALMLLVNPWLLIFDVGFILSFAATAGILIFGRPLAERLRFLPAASRIRETVSETLAATLTTLPISMFAFGTVSLIAPISNLAVLLIVPATTWFVICAALFGTMPFLGSFFVWLSQLLISSILGFIEFLGHLSFAAFKLGQLSSLVGAVVILAIIGFFGFKFRIGVRSREEP